MSENSPIYLNVHSSEKERERIGREEAFWTGRRLAALCAGSLGSALVVLYLLADWKSETQFPLFLLP